MALLLTFIIVYFIVVPMVVNGTRHTQYIWKPWCRDGYRGHWNPQMRSCAQHVINTMKPTAQQKESDEDIIRETMNDIDFYSFMKSCYDTKLTST